MKDLNQLFATAYRWLAIKFLIGIFLIASCYAFLVGFFVVSASWSTPLMLSPTQERVLAFQPQVATLEASLNKQRIERDTAEATVKALSGQAEQVQALLKRVDGAIAVEAKQLQDTGAAISKVVTDKKADIASTSSAMNDAAILLKRVDDEEKAHLITSDQASQRRLSIRSAMNAATDSKAQAVQLEQTAAQAQAGSNTLRGGSSNLIALNSVRQAIDLRVMSASIDIQLKTATSTVDALTSSIAELERVISVAKQSPYYLALREPVNVLFMPYENLKNANVGAPVYDCYLQVIACHKVGTVTKVYEAEEYARHPLFKTDLKGRFVLVKFDEPVTSNVVFVGGKPLFL